MPIGLNLLINDQYFKNLIFEMTNFKRIIIIWLNKIVSDLEKPIQDIDLEVKNRKKHEKNLHCL